jgi:hypothetical protein
MAKTVNDVVLDGALNIVKNNATRISICSAQPTTFTEAMTTYKLAIKTITDTDFTGPADNDGTGAGRKLTSNAHNGMTVDATGDGEFVALVDFANERVLYVTECDNVQTLTNGNTVNIPAWAIRIQDPV